VLRWARAHAQSFPWDEETCASAAYAGHLTVLQWAREHDCPWTEDLCASRCGWAPGGAEVGAGA